MNDQVQLIEELTEDVLTNQFGLKHIEPDWFGKLYYSQKWPPFRIEVKRVDACKPNFIWNIYSHYSTYPITQVQTIEQLKQALYVLTLFERETFI